MPESPRISLPKLWPTRVKSAMLHVISLAQFSMAYSRGWAADSVTPRLRLKARVDQLEQEVALLREEIRIKDVRMVGRQTKSILAADRPINGRESSRALTGRAHRRVQGHGLLSLANPVIGSH